MISKRDTKSEARLNNLSLTYMVEFCDLQLNYNKHTVYVLIIWLRVWHSSRYSLVQSEAFSGRQWLISKFNYTHPGIKLRSRIE